jgi:UDP-N-acetylglucosamine acyltransferase
VKSASAPASPGVHPTAIIDAGAELGADVRVGAFAIIGPGVSIGDRVDVGAHVHVVRDTSIGPDCVLYTGAVIGGDPQDLKYAGEASRLEVGARTRVREYCTLNRGTGDDGVTVVGDDCLLMAYSHVGHDSRVGDHAVLANCVGLGGHVVVGDHVTIGGLVGVHQFVRIGDQAFVGACSKATKDIPPFLLVDGHPCRPRGLNLVGLKRRGFGDEALRDLRRAFRILYKSSLNVGEAVEEIAATVPDGPELRQFLDFVRSSERGIVT